MSNSLSTVEPCTYAAHTELVQRTETKRI